MAVITIVTPCFNAARFLPQLLRSVAGQTLANWEHIIVDDGSTDASLDIATEAALHDRRVRVISQVNGGVARARQAGYRCASARTDYVHFLDADDVLEPTFLEELTGHLERHPEAVLAYCDCQLIDDEGRRTVPAGVVRYAAAGRWARALADSEPQTPFEAIYCWSPVMESCSVMRRAAFDRTSGWNPAVGQVGEGVDLFLQLSLLGETHRVPHVLYQYRRHASQASADQNHVRAQMERIRTKWLQTGPWPPGGHERAQFAEWFRTGPLRARLQAEAAGRYLTRGEWRHSLTCTKEMLQGSWRSLRGFRPSS
jgi:glycosyltransferase involved in cell wall biosynthesis